MLRLVSAQVIEIHRTAHFRPYLWWDSLKEGELRQDLSPSSILTHQCTFADSEFLFGAKNKLLDSKLKCRKCPKPRQRFYNHRNQGNFQNKTTIFHPFYFAHTCVQSHKGCVSICCQCKDSDFCCVSICCQYKDSDFCCFNFAFSTQTQTSVVLIWLYFIHNYI
jgi:hypothetical protein